jgi:hypothetical protein
MVVDTSIVWGIKDIFMVVGFFGGLIGIYIKHQIDFTQFKTETNLRLKIQDNKISLIDSVIEEQKLIQQEILLDNRETKTILQNIVKLLDSLEHKLDKHIDKFDASR